MLQVFAALALIGLGMGVDAYYQRRIRIAECDAYETGYQQGKKEGEVKEETLAPRFPFAALQGECVEVPPMSAPVKMPDNFEERLRTHGKATAWVK